MSFRIISRLFKNGRYILQTLYKRNYNPNILENVSKTRDNIPSTLTNSRRSLQTTIRNEGFKNVFQVGFNARKIFVDNVLNRVTNSLAADLRRRAAKRLLYGDSAPFFAFVGVSLASGSGILTKDDELEGVCWEIREAISKIQWHVNDPMYIPLENEDVNLSNLTIGPPIAKGCSAAVYAAKYNIPNQPEATWSSENASENIVADNDDSALRNLSFTRRRLDSFRNSAPNLSSQNQSNDFPFDQRSQDEDFSIINDLPSINTLHEQENDESKSISVISSKESNSFERLSITSSKLNTESISSEFVSISEYPIALKMMFNYDIQSYAAAILRGMQRETLPARKKCNEIERGSDLAFLPPHPNIVLMYSVFADAIPNLPRADTLFPSALPQRINPDGYGRNMSLFLLMKRYDCSLQNYLAQRSSIGQRESLILLAQLLEGVAHLFLHNIAHRDLKSDNILLEIGEDSKTPPTLVISDFGCSLADPYRGLILPYNTAEIDKGGNTALMAPEVILQKPGTFSTINYSKSDLWAAGTIAYEIFGLSNPFYGDMRGNPNILKNVDYNEEDLPSLPATVPPVVKHLVANMLQRKPNKRLSPTMAATVMQLLLWAPSNWIKDSHMPNSTEILQWMLCLTTKVLCEARLGSTITNLGGHSSNVQSGSGYKAADGKTTGRRTLPEYILISSFLARAKLQHIKRALQWIHNLEESC